jgi:hypothetical protein
MKTLCFLAFLGTLSLHADIVNGPNGGYIVNQIPGGNTLVTGENSSTYIQRSGRNVNIISDGPTDLGAIQAAQLVTPPAPQPPEPNYSMMLQPVQVPVLDPVYYPQPRQSRPTPTPEQWSRYIPGKGWINVDPPKGLKHTAQGEPLLNPYTHGVTPTDHPPENPVPWQQFLIDCKVPSNKLMRERTMFAYMDAFNALEIYKIQIGYDPASEKKYSEQFTALLAPLSADQKTQIRQHLCEDFGVKNPKDIETKEMIPYLRQWIRSHQNQIAKSDTNSYTK